MGLCCAMRGFLDAEIAIFGVSAQAVGLEVLFAVMADRDALLAARFRFGSRLGSDRATAFRLDGLARRSLGYGSLGCGSLGGAAQARPFLLHRGLCRPTRCCLLPGHFRALPFLVDRERLAQKTESAGSLAAEAPRAAAP